MVSRHNQAVSNADAPPDRRAGARIRTIYRLGKLVGGGDAGLCQILNISNGGAMIETGLSLSIGDWLSLEVAQGTAMDVTVAWCDGTRVGVEFARPIDCIGLLKTFSEHRWSGRSRPLRLNVEKQVEVTSGAETTTLLLTNISQKGLRLRDLGSLKPGMEISVRLSEYLVVHGEVRWSRGSEVGVDIQGKIPASILGSVNAFVKA